MPKAKGRAKLFADLEEKPTRDYDPETEPHNENAESDDNVSVDEDAGTEHYVSVGKSKLRCKEPLALGPKYSGARVSREALDRPSDDDDDDDEEEDEDSDSAAGSEEYESAQEGFDDPDEADLERDQLQHDGEDFEIDSGDAFGESDEEKFEGFTFRGSSQPARVKGKRAKRPTAADFMDSEAEESDVTDGEPLDDGEEDEDDEEEEDEDASDLDGFIDDGETLSSDDDQDDSDAEDASGDDQGEGSDNTSDDDSDDENFAGKGGRSDLKSQMNAGTKSVANAFASSIQKDIAKGKAVQQQRKAYDAALNIRIRLQKALVAANSFSTLDTSDAQSEPYEAAEAAAIKLLNTIGDYRHGMQDNGGKKRKRAFAVDTPSEDIWERLMDVERPAVARRKAVLDNWSKKVKTTQNVTSGISKGSKFTKVEEPLTMLLENQLQDPERLVKRTRVPRSCAPIQASQKVNEDAAIYDDADFYQLLLKELVDQRTADTSGPGGQAATVRYAAVKEAKNKKHVDTKASKGRKMRFNVHEKLQNFMAPEDRRGWEQHAIDRFFGTLFGQKLVLNEDDVPDAEMEDAVDAEEEGLRLFRN